MTALPNLLRSNERTAWEKDRDHVLHPYTDFSTFAQSGSQIIEKAQGMYVVGFTGKNDSQLSAVADICIKVPCARTMRVQECHLMAYHIIADLVEEMLFGDE